VQLQRIEPLIVWLLPNEEQLLGLEGGIIPLKDITERRR